MRAILADILFAIGHKLVIWSARLSGFDDIEKDLKNKKAHWLKRR
jgi:hypothetical protein